MPRKWKANPVLAEEWRERRRLARMPIAAQAEHLLAKAVYWESQNLDILAERDFNDAVRAANGVNVYKERDMKRPVRSVRRRVVSHWIAGLQGG